MKASLTLRDVHADKRLLADMLGVEFAARTSSTREYGTVRAVELTAEKAVDEDWATHRRELLEAWLKSKDNPFKPANWMTFIAACRVDVYGRKVMKAKPKNGMVVTANGNEYDSFWLTQRKRARAMGPFGADTNGVPYAQKRTWETFIKECARIEFGVKRKTIEEIQETCLTIRPDIYSKDGP